jgi:aspartokinase-like uncharacterized kinase
MIDAVVKVGGALLSLTGALDRAARAIESAARTAGILVVPGGGPFADAVRRADHDHPLGDDAAHWMAILGMEQYAHLLATRIEGARLVAGPEASRAAIVAGQIPILAPYAWLRAVDPLSHSWEVTSDSIAAWVAGAVGARRLMLIKAAGGDIATLADPYLPRVLPPDIEARVVDVAELTEDWRVE